MAEEDSTDSSLAERKKEFWDLTEAYFANDERSESEPRETLKQTASALFQVSDPQAIYVAKATTAGYRNQVWQGQAISRSNDLMLLIDKTGSASGLADAARSRLHPLPENGFGAIVICEEDSTGWKVRSAVEYEHVGLAEALKQKFNGIEIVRVPDPSSGDVLPAFSETAFADAQSAEALAAHLIEAKNVVLAGPPGTSKTYSAFKVVGQFSNGAAIETVRLEAVLAGRHWTDVPLAELQAPAVVWEFIQLHPSYSYEEFVRGLRTDPSKSGFSLISVDGILPMIAQIAAARRGRPTILIIDELNRCNLAAVFGETLFAIDPAQRGRPIRLQYEGEHPGQDNLRIPPELLVLATMNTADRSISAVDFAVRRRFRFLFLGPSEARLEDFYGKGTWRATVAITLLRSVNSLIADREIQLGHAYFMTAKESDKASWCAAMAEKLVYEICPLIREYSEEERLSAEPRISLSGIEIDLVQLGDATQVSKFQTAIAALGV